MSPRPLIADPSLFDSETPENPRLVKRLFQGRQQELEDGCAILERGLDIEGMRYQEGLNKRPWVIHGETRSGKSHLARRILAEFPTDEDRLAEFPTDEDRLAEFPTDEGRAQIIVHAREQGEAFIVMQDLFNRIWRLFQGRGGNVRFPVMDEKGKELFWETRELMDQVSRFSSGVESVTWEGNFGTSSSVQVEVKAAPLPKLVEFRLGVSGGGQRGEKESVTLRTPTPTQYAEYCGIMVDTLLRLGRIRHLLILVDDADLLEVEVKVGGSPEARERSRQRSQLANVLAELHRNRGIDVLITARSSYARSKKEFHELVDLNAFPPMGLDVLAAIYDVHLRIYAANVIMPQDFLAPEVVRKAGEWAKRLPGIFLQHLRIAYDAYRKEEPGQRDGEWYLEVFRKRYKRYEAVYRPGAEKLRESVEKKELEITVQADPFYGTIFDNEFVVQSYYSSNVYQVIPLVHAIFAKKRVPASA